jgi:hypothetical protein
MAVREHCDLVILVLQRHQERFINVFSMCFRTSGVNEHASAILSSHTLLPGTCLWVDFTHWYFGVYEKPAAPPCHFIHQHKMDWQQAVDDQGWHWGISEGSLPRCCLATLWVISVEQVCGRTIRGPTLQRLIDFLGRLWAACGWSGQLRLSSDVVVEVTGGRVDADAVVQAIAPTHAVQKQILLALEKCGANTNSCLLSTLAICTRRTCRLSGRSSLEVWVQYFVQIELHCVTTIEDHFISGHPELSKSLPDIAVDQYTYGKNKLTRKDPRSRAEASELLLGLGGASPTLSITNTQTSHGGHLHIGAPIG